MRASITEADDGALVARALEGDRDSYATLVDRHYDLTLRLAWRGTGNREDAQEVVQELWGERLPRRLHLFDGRSRFSTWLARVTINLTRDRMRSRHPTEQVGDDDRPGAGPDVDDLAFEQFVATLDPVSSFIAEARFRFDLELEAIGELCGLSTHQVKYRITGIKRAFLRYRGGPLWQDGPA